MAHGAATPLYSTPYYTMHACRTEGVMHTTSTTSIKLTYYLVIPVKGRVTAIAAAHPARSTTVRAIATRG